MFSKMSVDTIGKRGHDFGPEDGNGGLIYFPCCYLNSDSSPLLSNGEKTEMAHGYSYVAVFTRKYMKEGNDG